MIAIARANLLKQGSGELVSEIYPLDSALPTGDAWPIKISRWRSYRLLFSSRALEEGEKERI